MKNKLMVLMLVVGAATAHGQGTVGVNGKMSSTDPKSIKLKWVTLATGTNVVASTTNLQFTAASFYGIKASSNVAGTTNNAADAYMGWTDAATTVPGMTATIYPGEHVSIWGIGTKYNLTEFYFVGTTGDKVLIAYEQ